MRHIFVEADSTLSPEGFHRAAAVPKLVVDRRPHPSKAAHVGEAVGSGGKLLRAAEEWSKRGGKRTNEGGVLDVTAVAYSWAYWPSPDTYTER